MRYFVLISVLAFTFSACSSAADTTSATTPSPEQLQQTTVTVPTQQTESSSEPADGNAAASAYTAPEWAQVPLVDASTGETFRFADFAGKTVFVEPMATWCTNCRRQIPNAESARSQLPADQYVFVGLSVAENVEAATLAQYVSDQGWNFTFAVAPEALVEGLVNTFGRTVVTPPSTPHFIIHPDGSLSEMFTGTHSADELVAQLTTGS